MSSLDRDPKRVTSIPDIFGGADHYDEKGNYLGHSTPRIFGGVDHFNSSKE